MNKMILTHEFSLIDGFTGASVNAGIRKVKKDVSIIYSEKPCSVAGVFTKNLTKAAPVLISESNLKSGVVNAIIINSGNANACTGKLGYDNALEMVNLVSQKMGIKSENILVSSTGIIGVQLPMDKIANGISNACLNMTESGLFDVTEGIQTTDTFIKTATVKCEIGGESIVLTGMAKGSGMIHPNMATMLGYVLTNAPISTQNLQESLSYVVEDTFNMISVDGDTSTNDMVIALSNCTSKLPEFEKSSEEIKLFNEMLYVLCEALSMQIAKDGEGATKLLEVVLSGAPTLEDGKLAAKVVIASSLVKAAFFGKDANWGRITCALGYSGANLDPEKIDLDFVSEFGEITLMKYGTPVEFDEEKALEVLESDHIVIKINLNMGEFKTKSWGCDLTYDYVKINGEYRS